MLHVVFGEMGAGKNYYGEKLADKLQIPFVDGDQHMIHAWRNKLLTTKKVEEFVQNQLIPNLPSYDCVLAQALYQEKHRQLIGSLRPCKWYVVKPPWSRHLRNLYSRPAGLRWILFAAISKPWFESTRLPVEVLNESF